MLTNKNINYLNQNSLFRKVTILNIGYNPLNYFQIISFLKKSKNRKGYICFPDLYNILRANEDPSIKEIYNHSTLTLPDGKPSQFLLKKKGYKDAVTISGFWLCKKLLETNLSHYFYGTIPENLKRMETTIKKEFPKANILGFKSPPIIDENEIIQNKELNTDITDIFNTKPDIIWIGISSPKQDILMQLFHSKNEGTIMIGVGAVFDYFAGTAYMGPEWLKKIGLRWLYQLIKDPKRYIPRMIYIAQKLPKLLLTGHL